VFTFATMDNRPVVLFDGVCNLCNRLVQFIIKKDKKKQFLFASLQGKTGQDVLKKFSLPANDLNSFVLLEENRIYTKSTAGLKMLKKLGGGWQLLYAFIIVPKFIRNGIYNWIASNRYKWYGKKDACMIPTAELKERFLD
jgi:predicted DCC family thiol-disulfide oxidoreductase YuxK